MSWRPRRRPVSGTRFEVVFTLREETTRAGHDASEDGLDVGGRGRGLTSQSDLATVTIDDVVVSAVPVDRLPP